MASISSTSSLGNTALRGFGGMASGIDRDSIIEQMTLGTTTKINNQKKKMQQLTWKQEAYRGVSDKIIDLTDKFASYSSSSNLKDPMAFAKSLITVHGKDTSSKFVTATGSSQLMNNISILGVEQLASSTVRQSSQHIRKEGLATELDDLGTTYSSSKLEGANLNFGMYNTDGKLVNQKTFTFASSYTDDNGKKHTIHYTPENGKTWTAEDGRKLAADLNYLLKDSEIEFGEGNKASDAIQFVYENDQLTIKQLKDTQGFKITNSADSGVMKALGYEEPPVAEGAEKPKGISIATFADNVKGEFTDTAIHTDSALDYLTGKKLTFNYNGSKKDIELITADEKAELMKKYNITDSSSFSLTDQQKKELLTDIKTNLQSRLDKAYGNGAVKVNTDDDKPLSFTTGDATSTVTITSNSAELLKNIGIENGDSNKVNLSGKLDQFLSEDELKEWSENDGKLVINGATIDINANSSINDILSKINSNTEAGVKATYVDATGKFVLVSNETGAGREITLDNNLAKILFGECKTDGSGNYVKDANGNIQLEQEVKDGKQQDKGVTYGENAKIAVSYGNGLTVELERSSNSFNLEGLNVTVSGKFGEKDADGKWISSEAVTFTAKADVDAVTEKVKSFFEDFNALVTEINGQVTTRPDDSYQPLTDEQKAEMDETSIENWEKKAKQGMLYGDSAMRDLSTDVQAIFTKLMESGASYDDLKEIGISYSEDYLDGGTLVFDEAKFKAAMESDPDKVSNIFTGGGNVKKGLVNIVEDTFTPYATRYSSKNGNSYGRLIEIAGSSKKPTTLMSNEIYNQLKEMQNTIDKLNERLQTEQDRYISQFTTMETLINQMNTQSSYLSQLG